MDDEDDDDEMEDEDEDEDSGDEAVGKKPPGGKKAQAKAAPKMFPDENDSDEALGTRAHTFLIKSSVTLQCYV